MHLIIIVLSLVLFNLLAYRRKCQGSYHCFSDLIHNITLYARNPICCINFISNSEMKLCIDVMIEAFQYTCITRTFFTSLKFCIVVNIACSCIFLSILREFDCQSVCSSVFGNYCCVQCCCQGYTLVPSTRLP